MRKSDEWPAFNVERRPVSGLKPYKGNARTHSDSQVAQIAASITEWGWTTPILIDARGGVIAGHGRLLAAKSLGLEEVPVVIARGWSPAQKRAYILADNQLALNAGWDEDLLRLEIGNLGEMGFDLDLVGFGADFLADLLADNNAGLTDPDDAPAAPVNPVTRLGDLWLCGRHRVLCGDATKAEDVQTSLGGVKPHLMVTDPPYGVEYDPTWRVDTNMFARGKESHGKVSNDDRADWRESWALFPGDVAYVWSAGLRSKEVIDSLLATGFRLRAQIIWVKQHFQFSRGDYHWQHEPCWYVVRGKGHWAGDRKQTTVWEIANKNPMGGKPDDANTSHSAQKPVECMRRPIVNNSSPGQALYDPFLGSGTTIIAAEMEGRSCLGLEISPAYVDVAVERWQNFTGESATIEGDGRTFAEIESERKSYAEAAE